jgi:3-dehydroquinate synthase class II
MLRLEGSCRRLQVKELAGYIQQLAQQGAKRLRYDVATVTRLQPAGMGDRWAMHRCPVRSFVTCGRFHLGAALQACA